MPSPKRFDSQPATLPVPRPAVVRVLLCGVCLAVAYATLLPFRFTVERVLTGAGAMPHLLLTRSPVLWSDVVGNVMLFVPFGAFAWMGSRREHRNVAGLWRAALAGAAFSLCVEILQCFTPTRTPAASDVLANALGSLAGAALAGFAWPRLRRLGAVARWSRSSRREPLLLAWAGLVILIGFQGVVPFDYSLQPQGIQRAVQRMLLDPTRDPAPFLDAGRFLLFALFGGVTLQATRNSAHWRMRSRVAISLGCATFVALVSEMSQSLFKSHVLALRDVLGTLAGAAAGMLVAWPLTRGSRSQLGWGYVTGVYALVLLLTAGGLLGASGVEIMRLRLQASTPAYAMQFEMTLAAVTRFTELFLLHVPLGFLLARELERRVQVPPWSIMLTTLVCMFWTLPALLSGAGGGPELGAISWCVAAALGGLVGGTSWLWFEASREAPQRVEKDAATTAAAGRTPGVARIHEIA